MKKQLLMFPIIVVLLAFGVSAYTENFTNPQPNTIITGTMEFIINVNSTAYNCANTSGVGCSNITHIGINYTRTSPTIGSETSFCTNSSNVNNGTGIVSWKCSGSTLSLEDEASYNFTLYTSNDSQRRNNTGIVNILIDNTLPTVSIDQAANTLIKSGSITATVTNVSYCRIRFSTTMHDFNMTLNTAGTSCSYALSSATIPDSTYDITITVRDAHNGTSTVKSIPIKLRTDTVGGNVGKAQITGAVQTSQAQQTKNWTILIIVIIVGYLVSQGKLKNMFR